MKIVGYIFGVLLALTGGLLMIGALANAVNIHLLSDGPTKESGNGVLGIALAAAPLVIGLIILSKVQKSGSPAQEEPPAEE